MRPAIVRQAATIILGRRDDEACWQTAGGEAACMRAFIVRTVAQHRLSGNADKRAEVQVCAVDAAVRRRRRPHARADRRLQRLQREVRVESTTLKWGEPFYTKLITASVVGAGPDLATIHLSRMPNLAGGGVLRPIGPAELQAAGLRGQDFLPRQWDQGAVRRARRTRSRSTCTRWSCTTTRTWPARPACSTRTAG
jgi:hypothetical protein